MPARSISRIRRFRALSWHEKINHLRSALVAFKTLIYYKRVFGSMGAGCRIHRPTLISNPQWIHLGERVLIRPGVRLEVVALNLERPPSLRIGSDVNIEQDVHIVAVGDVIIGDNVSITARCAILGGVHPFFDTHSKVKIGNRLAGGGFYTCIGEGTMLGIGCVVNANVRIGKHVVVGAQSVVKKSLPDYCVADGNPARVVMKYDHSTDRWLNAD